MADSKTLVFETDAMFGKSEIKLQNPNSMYYITIKQNCNAGEKSNDNNYLIIPLLIAPYIYLPVLARRWCFLQMIFNDLVRSRFELFQFESCRKKNCLWTYMYSKGTDQASSALGSLRIKQSCIPAYPKGNLKHSFVPGCKSYFDKMIKYYMFKREKVKLLFFNVFASVIQNNIPRFTDFAFFKRVALIQMRFEISRCTWRKEFVHLQHITVN